MKKNNMYRITEDEVESIRQEWEDKGNIFIVDMDGSQIQTEQDYLQFMYERFHFPKTYQSLDGFNDWIRDLTWLEKDGYVLFIHNFKDFIEHDRRLKGLLIVSYFTTIFPWWEKDVVTCMAGGTVKPFNVYLVD